MKVYPFAYFLIACAHTSGQSGCPLHAYVLKPHPLLTIFHLSFPTLGGTGPGVHDEGRLPDSRDGGKEQSLPAAKRARTERHISALEVASANGESTTHMYTRHLPQQHQHQKQSIYQELGREEAEYGESVTPASHPLSQSLPVVPDTALEKYALFLRACYTQHGCSSTKWPPLDAVNYVNLAVISSEYANKNEMLKFRQQTIHGSIDDILEWKGPIAMQDILKPNYTGQEAYPVTQLLIEGAPGIGKSTFAWEVCQKWGQHQLLNKFSLVVLLKFRDKKVQDA